MIKEKIVEEAWFIWGIILSSLSKVVLISVILVLTVISQRVIKKLIKKAFINSSLHLNVDETRYRFFRHFVSALIYVIGIGIAIYMIPSLRTLSVSLFAGAGILAVIIGFASQQALSNVVSGIFIAIFKPFRVGDRISIGATLTGVVEDINLRHTIIRNFENKHFIVPNSIISNEKIENASIHDERICRFIDFSISYDSNIDKALKIMVQEAKKHPNIIDARSDKDKKDKVPLVRARVVGFADSSVNLRAWVWAKDSPSAFVLGCDLNKSIKERFDKEGVEIPFPYRTIVYKNDMKKRK